MDTGEATLEDANYQPRWEAEEMSHKRPRSQEEEAEVEEAEVEEADQAREGDAPCAHWKNLEDRQAQAHTG